MGPDRFQCYKAAAEVVVEDDLWNTETRQKQQIKVRARDTVTKPVRYPPRKKEKADEEQQEIDYHMPTSHKPTPSERPSRV